MVVGPAPQFYTFEEVQGALSQRFILLVVIFTWSPHTTSAIRVADVTCGDASTVANMDFLKSAVASALAQGPPFPYSFGDRVEVDNSIWALNNGTKRVGTHSCPTGSHQLMLSWPGRWFELQHSQLRRDRQ